MPMFGSSYVVTVVRGRGTPEEKSWQAQMGGDMARKALFYLDDRVSSGDEIHSEVFDEPKIISKVDPCLSLGGITHWEAQMMPQTEWRRHHRDPVLNLTVSTQGSSPNTVGNDPDRNVENALQLEKIKLTLVGEAQAAKRDQELNALERKLAAQGGALSGGRLIGEIDIVFGGFESSIEEFIACRKELGLKVPELFSASQLERFHATLDHHIDLALQVIKRRFEKHPSIKTLPAASIEAALRRAKMRADVFKGSLRSKLKTIALEGAIGMHRESQQQHITLNVANSTIASLNLGTVIGNLNGSIQTLATAGQTDLADAVRQLSDAIGASSELADDAKKEMIETVAYVSEQATLPAESRKLGPLRASVLMIKQSLGTIVGLANLVLKFQEALRHTGIPHA